MLLKTILNRIERHKSFVYGKDRIVEEEGQLAIEIEVEARANGQPICSGCGHRRPGDDRMPEPRRFHYVPLRGWRLSRFWEYFYPACAAKFLDEWCTRTMRSKIEPMKKVAKTLRRHRDLIRNWFRAEGAISAGIVEGQNTKAKLTIRKAYGFRTENAIETALYHQLENLPEPESTHRFC